MTNTPSPTDEDRELIERLRRVVAWDNYESILVGMRLEDCAQAADRLESLLLDRAKLEEALMAINFLDSPAKIRGQLLAALNRSTDHTP